MRQSLRLKHVITISLGNVFLAVLFCLVNPAPLWAQITWNWSFGSESGIFTTDGNLVGGLAPADTYNIDEFAVTSTAIGVPGSLSGGEYHEGAQPGQGFIWDGMAPTQFFRDGGNFTNGAVYFWTGTDYRWIFIPTTEGDSFIENESLNTRPVVGPLTLAPVIPEPSTLTLAVFGLLGAGMRRRTRT